MVVFLVWNPFGNGEMFLQLLSKNNTILCSEGCLIIWICCGCDDTHCYNERKRWWQVEGKFHCFLFFVCVFLHLILYIHKVLDLPIVLHIFIDLQLRFFVFKCLIKSFMCSSCRSKYHCNKRKRWQWAWNKCELFWFVF
jgi:hypothetical protein